MGVWILALGLRVLGFGAWGVESLPIPIRQPNHLGTRL